MSEMTLKYTSIVLAYFISGMAKNQGTGSNTRAQDAMSDNTPGAKYALSDKQKPKPMQSL